MLEALPLEAVIISVVTRTTGETVKLAGQSGISLMFCFTTAAI